MEPRTSDCFRWLLRRQFLFGLTTLSAVRPALLAPCAAQPPEEQQKRRMVRVGEATTIYELQQPWNSRWFGGRLVGVEQDHSSEPLLFVYDGALPPKRIRFRIPDGGHITIFGIAIGPEGQIALSGSAYFDDGKAGTFLATISPRFEKPVVARTWPTVVEHLAWGPDGAVWAAGHTFDEYGIEIVGYDVFRRFNAQAELLSSTVLDPSPRARGRATYVCHLVANSRSICWMSNQGNFVELDQSGEEILRVRGPDLSSAYFTHGKTLVASESGVVMYASYNEPVTGTWTFDRSNRTWVPTELAGVTDHSQVYLLGFQDEDLIASSDMRVIHRYRVSPSQ